MSRECRLNDAFIIYMCRDSDSVHRATILFTCRSDRYNSSDSSAKVKPSRSLRFSMRRSRSLKIHSSMSFSHAERDSL